MSENNTIIFSEDLEDFLLRRNESEGYAMMLFCAAGKMQIDLNHEHFELKEGDLLFCHPHFIIGHYMRTPDFHCRLIGFVAQALDEMAFLCFREDNLWWEKTQYLFAHPILHLTERQTTLINVFAELNQIYGSCEITPTREKIKNILLQAGILEILSWLEELIPKNSSSKKPAQKEVIFRRFIMLLQQSNGAHREVKWFANELSITPKYLTTVCKEVSGRSASELIDEFTLQEIRRLLQHTDFTTKEISVKLGFSNLSFFCKYVKRGFGMTVTEYRQTLRNNSTTKDNTKNIV